MKDNFSAHTVDNESIGMKMMENCGASMHVVGEITDKITHANGRVEVITGHNLVVNSFAKLIMALCKNQQGYGGIQYWAVGSGSADWDTTPVDPTNLETHLVSEIGRVAIDPSEITFLDNSYQQSDVPTNIIQIKHMFNEDDCNGKWREFGLFGGNATSDANSGIMVNKKHHAVITKTAEMTIERTMRFTINLV